MSVQYWQQEIAYLKGVGPKRAALLQQELGIATFEDLLHHYPHRHIDRSAVTDLADVQPDMPAVTLIGRLGSYQHHTQGRRYMSCSFTDNTGMAQLVWFHQHKWVMERYAPGELVVLYGKPVLYKNSIRFMHPELESLKEKSGEALTSHLKIVPVHSTTDVLRRAGLDARGLRRLVQQLLLASTPVDDHLPQALVQQAQLLTRQEALQAIHFPVSAQQLQAAQYRIKFDELFLFECVLALRKQQQQATRPSVPFAKIGPLFNQFYEQQLPFALTHAQKRVVKEIRQDVARTHQMNRLVQGDVGSGKTIVAVMSMLMALDNGYQAALLAPTELLAEQHYQNLTRYLQPLGIQVGLLTGSIKGAERQRVLAAMASGQCGMAIGTHALLEPGVQFKALGLTVIDEQHKFGVLQRAALWHKAQHYPHNLAMTATPIPRTLAMTVYGDVDVSTIDELPPGRKPIKTVRRSEAQRLSVLGFLQKQLAAGAQVYVVYPLIEESAKSDLADMENGYEALRRALPQVAIGIVHGRMTAELKEREMQQFKRGVTQLLVSTTVIEVGVDVPKATIMLIENAERFGLAQLHQLRGRVGRGGEQSYCILMAKAQLSTDAKTRLQAMCETTDGFRIAEVDLALRGPGDVLGTKQSGLPTFALADLATDQAILRHARDAAFALMAADPGLVLPEHQALRKQLGSYAHKHRLDLLLA